MTSLNRIRWPRYRVRVERGPTEVDAESIGHNEAPNAPALGYEFQDFQILRLLKAFEGYSTVSFTDMRGNEITLKDYRRRGRDGGIDVFLNIEADARQFPRIRAKVIEVLDGLGVHIE
jgi:hypothetical protein